MFEIAVERLALLGYAPARVERPRVNTTGRPRVSVVIPCYNYGHYLRPCLDSVLSQPGVTVDVLVIDDASPDGSADVVCRLAAEDDRVRTICHQQNRGHIRTYNEGLAQAEGEYVVLLSADDLLTPGALRRATGLMEAHTSVGLVYGHPVDFSDDGPPAARTTATTWTVWAGADWLADRTVTGRNPLRSPEAVMRTAVLKDIGAYREDLPHAADFELWMRAAQVADVGFISGADQAFYRVHAANMHLSTFSLGEIKGAVGDLQQRRDCFTSVLAGAADRRLLDRARRTLAAEALTLAIRCYEWGKADESPIHDLLAFARETCPPGELRGLYRSLAIRQRVSSRWIFKPAGRLYNARTSLDRHRWRSAGV